MIFVSMISGQTKWNPKTTGPQYNFNLSTVMLKKGVDGNSVVFATINSDRAGLPSDKKRKKNRKKKVY